MAAAKKTPKKPEGPYCYALLDDGVVFYIGKGRGLRMYQHEAAARRGKPGVKCDRIRAILAEGREVETLVLGEYETDALAYQAERAFIAASDSLTNQNRGGAGGNELTAVERAVRRAQGCLTRMVPFDRWHPQGTAARFAQAMGGREQAYRTVVQSLLRAIANPEWEVSCEAVCR